MEYRVIGISRETGRQRKRTYIVQSEAQAREHAEADGLSVQTVEKLPPEPPTERQMELLADLGVALPAGICKAELGDLLDQHLRKDKLASQDLRALAERYGLVITKYVGKKRLFQRIFDHLQHPDRRHDLCAWFVYRVYRELVKGSPTAAITSPHDEVIRRIAGELVEVPGVLQSIRRYRGEDLVWFGQWTDRSGLVREGASNRTNAYKEAAQRLRPVVSAERRAAEVDQRQRNAERAARPIPSITPAASRRAFGCLPVACGFAVLVWLAGTAAARLFA